MPKELNKTELARLNLEERRKFINKNSALFSGLINDYNCFKNLDIKTKNKLCKVLFSEEHYRLKEIIGEVMIWDKFWEEWIFEPEYIKDLPELIDIVLEQ